MQEAQSATRTRVPRTRRRTVLLIVAAVVLGYLGRSVAVDGADSVLLRWLPWNARTSITLFFGDTESDYLVPVSRTVSRGDADPEVLVEMLLAGPEPDTGLVSLLPPGTVAREVSLDDGSLTVDLSGAYATAASFLAHEAAYQSMGSWPDVVDVQITVDGVPLETNTTGHLLYFYDEAKDRLVAQTTNRVRAGDVLQAYLDGPDDPALIGLPAEVEALDVELASNDLLTLSFSFPAELRSFAVSHPESVRRVLEGLIASFNTGFPEIGAVRLDFDGHNALGLGQCANLLNTAQQMPETLNDERVLARYSET